ncbi:MAG: hypothetical protein ACXWVR_09865, partial [Rhodoplanes sp.]
MPWVLNIAAILGPRVQAKPIPNPWKNALYPPLCAVQAHQEKGLLVPSDASRPVRLWLWCVAGLVFIT